MINKKFKTKTKLHIFYAGKKLAETNDQRQVKKWIYTTGIKGTSYKVCEVSEYGEVLNEWVYSFKESGVIFTAKTYSLWEEMVQKAKQLQYEISY